MLSRQGSFYVPKGNEYYKVLNKLGYRYVDFSSGFVRENFILAYNNISIFKNKLDFSLDKLKYKNSFSIFGKSRKFDINLTFNKNFEMFIKDCSIGLKCVFSDIYGLDKIADEIGFKREFDKDFLKKVSDINSKYTQLIGLFARIYNIFIINPKKVSKNEIKLFERLFIEVFSELNEIIKLSYDKFSNVQKNLKFSF